MSIESATYINQLDSTKPGATDLKSEGDDHLRLLKAALKATFAAFIGAPVTMTEAQLNSIPSLAPLASPALSGTPTVPTAVAGTSSLQAASTAFVQAAIAAVNAQLPMTLSVDPSLAIAAVAGQHVVCTNAAAVTITLPAAPTAGQTVWVTPGNGRTDNVIARNGNPIMGLAEDMTIDNTNATVELRFLNATLGWRLV